MLNETVDLLTLGTGSAGQGPSFACREAGWRVAMIDNKPPGGTCSQRGCDAKRPLIDAMNALRNIQQWVGSGVKATEASIDWPTLIQFKRQFTEPIPDKTVSKCKEAGVNLLVGDARFINENTVEIGDHRIQAKKILIATGLHPKCLGIQGHELLIDSAEALDLDVIPKKTIFIGGGYISHELGHIFNAAGSNVTIVTHGDAPLKQFDHDLVEELVKVGEDLGIKTCMGIEPSRIESTGGKLQVYCDEGDPCFTGDMVINGAGRVPSLEGLHLDAAGIESCDKGVKVNAYLQSTSNPIVYAAGDVAATAGQPLTPVASIESRAVKDNLLHGNCSKPDYSAVPSVVFTHPPLAGVGLTEQQAKADNIDIEVAVNRLATNKLLKQVHAPAASCKLIFNQGRSRLLGAHYLGPDAEEIINIFAMIIRLGLSPAAVKGVVFTYPSICILLKGML